MIRKAAIMRVEPYAYGPFLPHLKTSTIVIMKALLAC